MKILIVDDSKAMRMIVRRTLRQSDLGEGVVVEASNGAEALDLVRSDEPDLILCDWNMPEMNGIDLLQQLQQNGFSGSFGFVTSETSAEMQSRAFAAGARFLIPKPFTPDAFHQALSPLWKP